MSIYNLNKFGLRIWVHKEKLGWTANRPYDWCDNVMILDGRRIVKMITFREFVADIAYSGNWIPMNRMEYDCVKAGWKAKEMIS